MRTILAAAGLGLAAIAGAATPPPPAIAMAATTYRVPERDVEAVADAMVRHMRLDPRDVPQALGVMAACGKEGAFEFRDLVGAFIEIAPAWHATFGRRLDALRGGVEGLAHQAEEDRRQGVANVNRLCRALESARRGYGSSRETANAMRRAITGTDDASRIARAIMTGVGPADVDGAEILLNDYRMAAELR